MLQDEDGIMYLIRLTEKTHALGKSVWLWTGDIWENIDLGESSLVGMLIKECDVVVDGPFIESEKDISLGWRGSANQRVIDVKSTLKNGTLVVM